MNQYRHSKSSLFLMEIILNILFFSILATFCVQIFFKGYQLSKSTEKLHQAVTESTTIKIFLPVENKTLFIGQR